MSIHSNAFAKCFCASVMFLFCLATLPARAADLSDEETKAGFVSLFNGTDFTNWRFAEESPPKDIPKNWKVEEGMIRLAGGGKPHLASAKEYADFELKLEWNAHKTNYNSGIYIRSGKSVDKNQINLAFGKQGSFASGGPKEAKPVPDLQKPPGEWNEWRVLAEGDKLSFWCNGKLAWEATGFTPDKGYIGIQAEGAAIDFKNIRIREIKK